MTMIVLILSRLLDALKLVLVVRCILSWIPNFQNAFTELIYKITDPVLQPVQSVLYRCMRSGGIVIDFSPLIVYFLIELVQTLLLRLVG